MDLSWLETLLQLVVEGFPNLMALVVMVYILFQQGRRHEERLDELLDWCFEQRKKTAKDDNETRQEETD